MLQPTPSHRHIFPALLTEVSSSNTVLEGALIAYVVTKKSTRAHFARLTSVDTS